MLKDPDKGLRLEWLSQVAKCSARPRSLGEHVVMGGDEDDRRRRSFRLEAILKIEAAHATEVDVEDDAFGVSGDIALEEFLGRSKALHAKAVDPKGAHERGAKRGVVIDDTDP
jgi:hypothetical protein